MSSSQKGKLHFLVTGSALGTTSQAGTCASILAPPLSPFSGHPILHFPMSGLWVPGLGMGGAAGQGHT